MGTQHIVRGGDRLGIYFLEHGRGQRGSKVVYDRADSSLATIQPGMVDWDAIFADADWFHWTGITPAISEGAAAVCLEAVKAAKAHGVTVSSDLNYRNKLWKWGKKPGEVMQELVSYCDVAIGNEEDADKVFGIHAPDADVTAGEVDADGLRICLRDNWHERFPNLKTIAITLRGSISASHNTWSARALARADQTLLRPQLRHHPHRRPGRRRRQLHGRPDLRAAHLSDDKQHALNFAVAASCPQAHHLRRLQPGVRGRGGEADGRRCVRAGESIKYRIND